jgi:hypothetical protein
VVRAGIVGLTLMLATAARAERVALDPANHPRIVHGLDTHAFPTAGALLYSQGGAITPDNAGSWCSGTLIGCESFLVAAHCVDDPDPSHYLVYLQHAGLLPVASITRHPSYLDATFPRFDAAVIKLGSWVTGVTPTPINLIDPLPFVPADGTIVGFGQTHGGANDYGIKRVGTVQTRSCPADVPSGATDSDVVCWSFSAPSGPLGTDANTCNGDSGGPLFLDLGSGPVVAGITSGGSSGDCLAVDHSYDANVFTHRNFILAALAGDSASSCGGLPPADSAAATVIGDDGALSGAHTSDSYTVSVPVGANALRVALNGEDNGSFNVNLYVKQGAGASSSTYDCKADGLSVFGACSVDLPAAGTWSIAVERAAGTGDYQLTTTIFGGAAPVCGNDRREFNEACDGTDAALCPTRCAGDCSCPTPVCGNGVSEPGEQCDGADATSCPGQCDSGCHCPVSCTQGDLVDVMMRVDASRYRVRGRVLNFDGVLNGADPRLGFRLTLTQGSNAVAVDIPANDPGWAPSNAGRGLFRWKGSRNGITLIKALDRSARNGTWRFTVSGGTVPGAGNIDVGQPVDIKLSVDGACTRTTY